MKGLTSKEHLCLRVISVVIYINPVALNSNRYELRLFLLGTAVVIAGIISYMLLSRRHGGSTWVSHGITWTPVRFILAFAVILIVTLAIGTVLYRLPHP